jgi:hypothetical protein
LLSVLGGAVSVHWDAQLLAKRVFVAMTLSGPVKTPASSKRMRQVKQLGRGTT